MMKTNTIMVINNYICNSVSEVLECVTYIIAGYTRTIILFVFYAPKRFVNGEQNVQPLF